MGYEYYWASLRLRIETRLAISPCLEGLVVRQRITKGAKKGSLSYCTKRMRLVAHSYTQDVSVEKLS